MNFQEDAACRWNVHAQLDVLLAQGLEAAGREPQIWSRRGYYEALDTATYDPDLGWVRTVPAVST